MDRWFLTCQTVYEIFRIRCCHSNEKIHLFVFNFMLAAYQARKNYHGCQIIHWLPPKEKEMCSSKSIILTIWTSMACFHGNLWYILNFDSKHRKNKYIAAYVQHILQQLESNERYDTHNPLIYFSNMQCKKISNDQELIQSDPTSCPQNQKGND